VQTASDQLFGIIKENIYMVEVYISVDIETSGPIPGKYSMLALGACQVGREERRFYAELRPTSQQFVPAAMKIVGRSLDEFAQIGQEPREAMRSFRDWIAKTCEGGIPVFVGFNAAFDWSFVNWYFHTYLEDNPFGFTGLDIKSYYMGLMGCSWADTKLSCIAREFKSGSSHSHNALEDSIEQGKLFELMRGRLRREFT
jgi:DNA polymerase III epsilon subunit-like protein